MDRERRNIQSLGLFGILMKSLEIIFTSGEIFSRLSLTLILPFSLAYFAYLEFFYLHSPVVTASHMNALEADLGFSEDHSSIEVSFTVVCAVFSILSTTFIAHVVAYFCSGKKATMTQVIRDVIPRVLTRLVENFLFAAAPMSVLESVFKSVNSIIVLSLYLYPGDTSYIVLSATLSSLRTLGDCYLRAIWQLVGVVSVLEEGIGFQAMSQSKRLMKGNMGISLAIYAVKRLCSEVGPRLYKSIGEEANRFNVGMSAKVGLNLTILLLHCFLVLLPLVIDTVFYLVCKSCQRESGDKIQGPSVI